MNEEDKKHEYDDPEQSTRFIEMGEQLLEDDAEEKLDEAMKRIATARKTPKSKQQTDSVT